ncbi:MAG: DedA family protein [Prevotellaceae bacterium]|jgi:membrane protein DedA with SNARE-associated domain|nr:DedA family protein [Prevotellaceae bacterium]
MKKILIFLLTFSFSVPSAFSQSNQPDTNLTVIQKIERWYENNINYGTITVLMAAESSILPVPSELVIPPAAYIASKKESNMNIFLVILFGTIGALAGATLNYYILGMWIGRPLLYKFADSKAGHFLLLSSEKLQRAENYFNAHGKISTFAGRFIPVVRHLISIPAGFAKMNYPAFALFTFAGAGLWNVILAGLGYIAHGQADVINKYSHELSIAFAIIVLAIIGVLIVKHFLKKRKNKTINN